MIPDTDVLPFRAFSDQMADALIYSDRQGLIRYWNPAAERLTGFAAGTVLGQSLDLIIPERLRQAHWLGFYAAMTAGRTRHDGRATLTKVLTASGDSLRVHMSFAVITDSAGQATGALAVAREAPTS